MHGRSNRRTRRLRKSSVCMQALRFLVADRDQVISKLLDSVGASTGLHLLIIGGDNDGLAGLDDDATNVALRCTEQRSLSDRARQSMFGGNFILNGEIPRS
jgi:hypothetical protein